jgi:hypothetical protein
LYDKIHVQYKVKVKLSLWFNWEPCNEGILGEWRCSFTYSDLGTRWRWVVSFTLPPLYPQGKRPWYPLNRSLGGPQSQYMFNTLIQNVIIQWTQIILFNPKTTRFTFKYCQNNSLVNSGICKHNFYMFLLHIPVS